jgi:hypothetical protein
VCCSETLFYVGLLPCIRAIATPLTDDSLVEARSNDTSFGCCFCGSEARGSTYCSRRACLRVWQARQLLGRDLLCWCFIFCTYMVRQL